MGLWSRFIAWLDFGPRKLPSAESISEYGGDTITEHVYDWGKTIDIPKGDFDCILNGPYFKLGYPDKPPLKRSKAIPLGSHRKPAKPKVPKKGTSLPKKGKKPAKARTERNKPIPTKGGRKK